MAEEAQSKKPHCLILPFPMQGHINPMLQFAKRLVHKGLQLTLILTKSMANSTPFSSSTIDLETISDGLDHTSPSQLKLSEYITFFTQFARKSLTEVIQKLVDSGRRPDCIVYDSFITWIPDLAKELGIETAAFFTQSCAVYYIYECVCEGALKLPISRGSEIAIGGLPLLGIQDMPTVLVEDGPGCGSDNSILTSSLGQFENLGGVSWIFSNTFYELEKEVIDHMSKGTTPMQPIGPTIPSTYLDKRLTEDTEYGFNVFRPNATVCIEWLNRQSPESVVYISFGSFAKINEKQMEELAWGLKLSNKPFLWVVRASEMSKLPKDFISQVEEKGLIVSWSTQLEVLAHNAVSCFVTHCGWNSTLEALCLGIPMVAIPQWSDQTTNSKFVTDVWRTGVRVLEPEKEVIGRETIEKCIREVMEGEKGEEMKKNAGKWKEMARAAIDEGGNSDTNIEHFVSSLRRLIN